MSQIILIIRAYVCTYACMYGCVCIYANTTHIHTYTHTSYADMNWFLKVVLCIINRKCPFWDDVKSENKATPPPASAGEEDDETPEMEVESEESEVELDMEGMFKLQFMLLS